MVFYIDIKQTKQKLADALLLMYWSLLFLWEKKWKPTRIF